jgi:hypothetical protein
MNKKQILASLNNIANKLDQQSEFEQADDITGLMVKISQMPIKQAGFMDALSTIGSGLYEAGGNALQGLGGIGSALFTNAGGVAGTIAGGITGGLGGAAGGGTGAKAYQNSQDYQNKLKDKAYREKDKMRVYVEAETQKIIKEITNYITANKNITPEAARQQAINKAQNHQNFQQINTYCTTYNKMSFVDIIATKFDTYVAKLLPQKNIEVKPNTWVPPVEKY